MKATARADAVSAYCRRHRLPVPQLLRSASGTSLYRSADLVIRVAAPGRSAMTGPRQVAAAALLAQHGVRTVTSAGPLERTPDGDELTVWEYIRHDADLPYSSAELGEQVRALHAIPVPAADEMLGRLPRLANSVARGHRRVEQLEAWGPTETGLPAGLLRSLFTQVSAAAAEACASTPETLLHGDLNPGNVLRTPGAPPYLIDLEAVTVGPWMWDLVNTQLLIAYGDLGVEAMDVVLTGYGRDVRDVPGWAALCWLRALNIVTWTYVEARSGGAAPLDRARRRVAWLLAGFPGLPPTGLS